MNAPTPSRLCPHGSACIHQVTRVLRLADQSSGPTSGRVRTGMVSFLATNVQYRLFRVQLSVVSRESYRVILL